MADVTTPLPPAGGAGGGAWYDFWTGEAFDGGQTVTKDVDLQTLPLYVRAGTILPFALPAQTARVSDWDTLQIRVYPGRDAVFTLYEDEGDTYAYEQGKYSTILFSWDDATQQLTVGQRQGSFPGMKEQRTFDICLVGCANSAALSAACGTADTLSTTVHARIAYDGKEQTVTIDAATLGGVAHYRQWPAPEDDGTEAYTFRAKDWQTGDAGRVAQSRISYDETANTITLNASGPQNAALQLNTKLDGHYYYMNDQHLFCVRGTGISATTADHQLWFMAGQHVGSVAATRTFTTPDGQTVVVWDLSDLIYRGNIVYLNLSGSFITCFGLTPATGQTVTVSDINFYTEPEALAIEAGTEAIGGTVQTDDKRPMGDGRCHDLLGRTGRPTFLPGLYIKNGKKNVIK